MKILTEKEILKKLASISGWSTNKKNTELSRRFKTGAFVEGLALTAKIAVHAELIGHHPTIEITYESVTVTLTTRDAKGLTKLDFELAERIDKL